MGAISRVELLAGLELVTWKCDARKISITNTLVPPAVAVLVQQAS